MIIWKSEPEKVNRGFLGPMTSMLSAAVACFISACLDIIENSVGLSSIS